MQFSAFDFAPFLRRVAVVAVGAFGLLPVCQAGLPSGYQAVEWIESAGAQGIDLGFCPPKAGGTSMDIDFELIGNHGGTAITSCGWYDWNNYILILQGSKVYFGTYSTELATYADGVRYHFTVDGTGKYVMRENGVQTKTGTTSVAHNHDSNNLWLFSDGANSGRYAYCRLFSAQFAVSDTDIRRDFMPARRTSDSKPGLYDRANDVFYPNSKSGADFIFGPDRLLSDDLKVSGSPVECGVPSVGYGVHGGYKVGDTVNVSVDRVGENAEGTIYGTCTGYTVLTNGAVYVSGDAGSGEKVNVSFAFPDCDHGAELVFAWKAQCKVSAVSSDAARGTVSKEYEWHEAGETFSVSATPKACHTFYRWVGSDGVEYGRNRDLTITVADTLTLTAEFGDQVTLSPSGGDDTEAIANALSTAPAGSEICLAAGTHQIVATIVLDKDIRLFGADRETTILRGNGKQRLVKIDGTAAPKASVESLTLRNGYDAVGWGGNDGSEMTTKPGGGAVLLSGGGTVTNCVVEECSGRQNGGAYGIHAVGGLVTHTIIRNLTSANTIVWGHGLIAQDGALVSHSVVSNCTDTSLVVGVASAAVVAGGAGTVVRNCLITDCRYGYNNGGNAANGSGLQFLTAGATVESTTIVGNRIGSAKGSAIYGRAAGTLLNCIVADNMNNADAGNPAEANIGTSVVSTYTASRPAPSGEGNLAAPEALFKNNSFELITGSSLIGSASVEDWMEDALDLKGVARLRAGVVDMGAYCYVPPSLACSIASASERKVRDAIDATITSSVEGETEGLVYHWDLDGDLSFDDLVGADKSSAKLETSAAGTYPVRLKVTNTQGDESVSEPITFVVVPSTLYVNAACTDPISPYGDPLHAATNVQDAVDAAMAGCVVSVAPGRYVLSRTLNVSAAITVRSSGSADDTVLHVGGTFPGVSLNASGIVFCGMTVTNGYLTQAAWNNGSKRGGGNLYAGPGTLVERCRFAGARCGRADEVGGVSLGVYNATVRTCEIINNNPNTGETDWQLFHGNVKVSGADSVVERCLIADNSQVKAHRASGFRRSAGLNLEGGAVRCCLFRNNRMTEGNNGNGTSYDRGVAVYAKAGVLENCTIVGNVSADVNGSHCPAVQAEGTAVVRNCIIWDNKATAGGDPAGEALSVANWGGTDGCFTYCCTTPALADEHSVAADPLFKDASALDGVLRIVSPCARGGRFDAGWMTSAVDFYGAPLAVGARRNRVGMGCVSVSNSGGLMLIVK